MNLNIFDARNVWHKPLIAAAQSRGHAAHRITKVQDISSGYGFIRPHPAFMPEHRIFDTAMRQSLTMIQDRAQVEAYEDKLVQFQRWGHLMPQTWHLTSRDLPDLPFPIVSKAREGASSVNVRIIQNRDELERHADQVFGKGIEVSRCADGHTTRQQGYLLLQAFVPHRITWRVNRIGGAYAVFKRFCYDHTPKAQTGRVEPVNANSDEVESLLEYAESISDELGSKWIALDILKAPDGWVFLESSLAWPTTAGGTDSAIFFGSTRKWGEIWHLLLDEIEAGEFD